LGLILVQLQDMLGSGVSAFLPLATDEGESQAVVDPRVASNFVNASASERLMHSGSKWKGKHLRATLREAVRFDESLP
jgi:hypothetical protein